MFTSKTYKSKHNQNMLSCYWIY